MPPDKNKLYYGDNLQVLCDYISDASVIIKQSIKEAALEACR
jgi:hypothetical protein